MKILTDDSRMPFGKHKDLPMWKVPASYLLWLWEEGLWHFEDDAAAYPDELSMPQWVKNKLAVARYIKQNFSALESEKA